MLLLDSAHHHAEVSSFDDDANTEWFNCLLDGIGDLLSQPLLHLQAASKRVHQPRNFTQADDFAFRKIRNMHFAEEWQHVMFTQAEHLDVLDDDHLVVIDFEQSAAQELGWVFTISSRQELNGFGHALWRSLQTVALRILAEVLENLKICFLQSRLGFFHFWRQSFGHRHHTFRCCAFHSVSLHTCAFGTIAVPVHVLLRTRRNSTWSLRFELSPRLQAGIDYERDETAREKDSRLWALRRETRPAH